ncbi:hypothetical protein Hfx1148_11095 [Haloferax sp. CBA1148]|nr:hypothetical protein Hfx1148_11095 [Haloferax sp. CBA1148]
MGFFRRAGRQVEQFKQAATETATQRSNYRCEACEARFDTRHEQCPECGAGPLVSVDSEE